MDENFDLKREISGKIHHIHRLWRGLVSHKQSEVGLDEDAMMYARILGYISFRREPTFQKNIEQDIGMNKSTVSMILTKLQKKNFIERQSVEGDARLKKIVLTPNGEKILQTIGASLYDSDSAMVKDFTEEEKQTLYGFLVRMENNMKEYKEDNSWLKDC